MCVILRYLLTGQKNSTYSRSSLLSDGESARTTEPVASDHLHKKSKIRIKNPPIRTVFWLHRKTPRLLMLWETQAGDDHHLLVTCKRFQEKRECRRKLMLTVYVGIQLLVFPSKRPFDVFDEWIRNEICLIGIKSKQKTVFYILQKLGDWESRWR